MSKEIYLIRHAKVQNPKGDDYTPELDPDIQFETITDLLFHRSLNVEKVFSSPMKRAIQTSEKIFDQFEVLDYIYEYRAPNMVFGIKKEDHDKFWIDNSDNYRNNPDWTFDGSESFNEIKARCTKLIEFLKAQPYQRMAVVAHTNFFRHLLSVNALGSSHAPGIYLDLSIFINFYNLEAKKMIIQTK